MIKDLSRRTFLYGLSSTALVSAYPGVRASAATGDWQANAPEEWEKVLRLARQEGQVTVGGFPLLGKKMSAAFERDTGIKMNYLGARPSQLTSCIAAEARANNMTIDAALGGGRLLALIPEGLMEPLEPQIILPHNAQENFRNNTHKYMDSAKKYLLQGSELVFGYLVVNSDIIDPDELKSWKNLLDPKYKGKIISHDPRGPGPGQGATSWLYNTKGLDFVKDLFLGQKAKYTNDNRQVIEAVVRGTHPIAFGVIPYMIERYRREGFKNIAVVLPEDGPGYLTGGFSVLKQARNVPRPNAAKVFINWYISKPGQEVYEPVMLEKSRRKDVDTGLPDYLKPKPGVEYYEAYNEKIYFSRKVVVKAITDALGSR